MELSITQADFAKKLEAVKSKEGCKVTPTSSSMSTLTVEQGFIEWDGVTARYFYSNGTAAFSIIKRDGSISFSDASEQLRKLFA